MAYPQNRADWTVYLGHGEEGMWMDDSFSWMENRIELRLCRAGARILGENCALAGEKLPFELFLYAAHGDFRLEMNGNAAVCPQGGTVLVPCDTAFRLTTADDCELVLVAADYRIFKNLRIFSLFELPVRLDGGTEPPDDICSLIRDTVLDSEFTNTRLEHALSVKALLYRLGAAVLRRSAPRSESSMIMERFARLAPVLSYIADNIEHGIAVEELARIMGMSEDGFYRLFKATLGEAPGEYIISERLRAARLLLTESALSVGEISRRCGYESPFYFSSLFRSKCGCPPSVYRERTAAIFHSFK